MQEKHSLTASDISHYANSLLSDTYDWTGQYYESAVFWFIKIKKDWYDETNQMIRFHPRIRNGFSEIGYEGTVAVMVMDDYQESMFIITTGKEDESLWRKARWKVKW